MLKYLTATAILLSLSLPAYAGQVLDKVNASGTIRCGYVEYPDAYYRAEVPYISTYKK